MDFMYSIVIRQVLKNKLPVLYHQHIDCKINYRIMYYPHLCECYLSDYYCV